MSTVAVAPEIIELLWPGAQLVGGRCRQDPTAELLCLPSSGRVRSLIPTRPPQVPVAVLTRRLAGRGNRGRLQRVAILSLLRAGLLHHGSSHVAHLVPTGGMSITGFISKALNRDVSVSVHLGAPRANRKPVLEVTDPAGVAVAYGKLGMNALTDRLVEAETGALTTLAERVLPHVIHPSVVAAAVWQGHPLLLQTPLPLEHAHPATPALVALAAREVAGSTETPCLLPDSEYFADLDGRISSLPAGEVADLLQHFLGGLAEASPELSFGAWHGDWTPWNMAAVDGRLVVWDWERYARPAPVGFDVLHHAFQSAVQTDPADAPAHALALVERAPQLLHWLDTSTARATSQLYLLDIAARYTADGQAAAGGRLGDVVPWVAPPLEIIAGRTIIKAPGQPRDPL